MDPQKTRKLKANETRITKKQASQARWDLERGRDQLKLKLVNLAVRPIILYDLLAGEHIERPHLGSPPQGSRLPSDVPPTRSFVLSNYHQNPLHDPLESCLAVRSLNQAPP